MGLKASKAPIDRKFRHPHNSTEQSDRALWALREVQDILKAPSAISDSSVVQIELMDGTMKSTIEIRQIIGIPQYDAMLVLSFNEGLARIFTGREWRHVATIDFGEARPIGGTATPDDVLLEFEGREFGLLPLAILGLRLNLSLAPMTNSEPIRVSAEQLRLRYAVMDDSVDYSGYVAFVSSGGTKRMLLWANDPIRLWRCDWGADSLKPENVNVANNPGFLKNASIGAACYVTANRHIYLVDCRGGRVLELNANEPNPRLSTIAGDGCLLNEEQARFGPAVNCRLGRIHSLCEFRIQPGDVDILRGIVKSSDEPPSRKSEPGRSKTARQSVTAVLVERPFLVAVMPEQKVAVSISVPQKIDSKSDQCSDAARRVLPLVPFGAKPSRAKTDFYPAEHQVVASPGIALTFYVPGDTKIQSVCAEFVSYAETKAYNKDVERYLSTNKNWVVS